MPISSVSSNLRPGVCTSTTRPTSPYEGHMVYETDTDMLAIWNGSAWRYVAATTPTNGTVLQVVSTTKTDAQAITPAAANTYENISGLTATITPKSTSSKILIIANVSGMSGVGLNDAFVRLARGSTGIAIADAAGSRTIAGNTLNKVAGGSVFNAPLIHLDSPSTTSTTTYAVQIATGAGTIYVNRTETDSNNAAYPRTTSNITLMEIAG